MIAAVDGSERAQQAALWAADEAARRGAELRIVEVTEFTDTDERERAMLDHVVRRCRQETPDLPVSDRVAHGHPATELVRASKEADLLVLGAHERTASRWASAGSVATRVATHAECPVVVVREPRRAGGVVVGLDGTVLEQQALHFAFTAARRRGTELIAVRARDLVRAAERFPAIPPLDFEVQAELDKARRDLDHSLEGWNERYPDVPVCREVRCGHPTAVLLHLSARARMLVVGHRGTGGFAGMLLGSTAAGVLRDAECPVAVLRGTETPRS
ncbi:universal stress protein [Saccharopolyspora gloriosae]|uniref:universal stress protein n=1 Tax=Saccharopolyspora gloriosae TaxID=455344 RepID=UPI0031B5B5E1